MSVQILIDHTVKAYRELFSQISGSVLQGQLTSLDQYKYNCGRLQGLRDSEELLASTYKTLYTPQAAPKEGEGDSVNSTS